MAPPSPHPRRRYPCHALPSGSAQQQSHPLHISTSHTSLKKSATFHSPTSPRSASRDPILSVPSLPRRSPTCSKDLENTIAAGDNRIAQLIGAVDRSLSGLQSFSSDSSGTFIHEALPVPRFMIDTRVDRQDCKQSDSVSLGAINRTDLEIQYQKHHTSDSGIGSTESSKASVAGDNVELNRGTRHSTVRNETRLKCERDQGITGTDICKVPCATSFEAGTVKTGINGAGVMALDPTTGSQHVLSEYACRQVQKHIILPIIREEKLKNFHPLVSGIPHRVARKEITCLRDLEKVLLWLAPKWSFSKASFLLFCETSIQCIHTTVEYLNEKDQRRPSDRPYSNGYFLDLVEQIRQYASVLAASRARTSTSPITNSIDVTMAENVSLVGGLSQTGRPAELVRSKNGRTISLLTGEEVDQEDYKQGTKRSIDSESSEDLLRSMARRRKSAGAVAKEDQKCAECNKVFKRPCDLTKHEKTHSRPWKCSDIGCKYHQYGWPTEKERDRHMNDKHSVAPSMFRCHYHPCPYESKRESNCKQHMEKAHGWVYVRSKNNGKTGKATNIGKSPPTPQMSTPGSNIFTAPSPNLSELPAYDPQDQSAKSVHESIVTSDVKNPYGREKSASFDEIFGPMDNTFYWKDASADYSFGELAEYQDDSHRPSWDSSMANTTDGPSIIEDQSLFGANFDWSNMDNDISLLNLQLITPATSIEQRPLDAFSRNPSVSLEHSPQLHDQALSLSPGAQGDAMLYSPYSVTTNDDPTDEGYCELPSELANRPNGDFNLFDSNDMTGMNDSTHGAMFGDLPSLTGWSGRGQDLAQQLGMSGDLMQLDD